MPALPIISGRDCIRALARVGYREVRQRGSHIRLACTGRSPVTVPDHAVLDRGTLRAILRTAELTVDDFVALLD
jgi:predicted RNA binding protein YcfA (HicA-like mRNA interferase family)